MEVLALEVSKILNVTVEKAIELMPLIKRQFAVYNIIRSAEGMVIGLCAISLIATIITSVFYFTGISVKDDVKELKKYALLSSGSLILFASILVASNAAKYLLAPDFMLLKEFLLK